jgi:choline dehydrogenase-like flavoprotein
MTTKVALALDDWSGHTDVLVIGSGPASVSLCEHLYRVAPHLNMAVIERGGVLSTTNVRNFWPGDRSSFIAAVQSFLWEGDFARRPDDPEGGGMMILGLGGRGIVAGAHLPRFYPADYGAWDEGRWPFDEHVLEEYYIQAEEEHNVGFGEVEGRAQNWAMSRLRSLHALPPPWAFDNRPSRSEQVNRGFDSSAARLWALMCADTVATRVEGRDRRLAVFTDVYATALAVDGSRVDGVTVVAVTSRSPGRPRVLTADRVVLAASPIESARLALNSGLGGGASAVGRFLAEHIYARAVFDIPVRGSWCDRAEDRRISLIAPPPGDARIDRFHVDVEGGPSPADASLVRIRLTGSAAMDPRRDNAVRLARSTDEYGVRRANVRLRLSAEDEVRAVRMGRYMVDVAAQLGSSLDVGDVRRLSPGRSHHEAGTLRMGSGVDAVTDEDGRVIGLDNLYVADASVFPSVGVANPMLTVTALDYRLAEHLGKSR